MTKYAKRKKQNDEIKLTKDMASFGIVGGAILVLICGLNYLNRDGVAEVLFGGLTIFGFLFIILGTLYPDMLVYIYKPLLKVTSYIGNAIFSIILLVIYVVLVLPVGLIMGKKSQHQYNWYKWMGKDIPEKQSAFTDWEELEDVEKKASNKMVYTFIDLIGFMAKNKQGFLIPVIVILVVFGLLLFFASSTVLAPFIYTLF